MRQVLIPGTNKAMPHPWQVTLAVARGDIPNHPAFVEEAYGRQQESVAYRKSRAELGGRRRRNMAGGAPYRNPSRIHRLRKNGRLREELR